MAGLLDSLWRWLLGDLKPVPVAVRTGRCGRRAVR
jgi:hypothetical protein